MEYQDKMLNCTDSYHDENTMDEAGLPAPREFTFSAQEQEFYAEKGFSEPQRCAACRAAKKARFSGSRQNGPRQMYPAVCAQCGRDAEVPFEPRGDKPVLCNECFQTQRQTA
jgi:CxxC-x17-CxxC domain-containing protein